jgi:hypothetical protein
MARGTNTAGDVLVQTADGRPLNDIWNEFQASLQIWNESRQRLVDFLTFPVTQPIEEVPQISSEDFEEASEFGKPRGIRGGAYFSLGYDFRWYDLAINYTWQYLAEATAAQVQSLNNMALEADNRLIFQLVMRAVFNNINRVATIHGTAVNVYPFYNADGTVPPDFKVNTFLGTHNHYITSGGAVVDSGDLDDMENHLTEHGYGKLQGSSLFLLVNKAELNTIRTFRVATGDSYDFIPSSGGPPFFVPLNTGGIVGGQPSPQLQGLHVAGVYGNWLIIDDDYVPAGYMMGFATGGIQNATNPIGFREHQNASLRGLRLVKGRDNDYPLIESFYNRGFGTGVRHRGAGMVMQISAAPVYVIPPIYA